jgi:TRAP-type C4-dicarboxylate transport system substrate-binding protein
MHKLSLRITGAVAAATLLAACGTNGGGGGTGDAGGGDREAVALRVADQYSLEHSIGKASIQPYMAAVEESTGGKVDFEYFADDSLVKANDIPEALRSGTADMGNILYIGNLHPLLYVVQLPGLFSDKQTEQASAAFWDFVQQHEPTKAKFEELGIVPLFCFTVPNYQLEFTDKGVDSFSELQGKQVRSAGVILPLSVQAIGGTPSDIAINEAYDAFNRGVIDSISLSVPSVKAYAFMELIDSAIVNADLGGFPVCYGVGQAKWDSLPEDVRETMREEGEKIVTAAPAALYEEVQEDLETWKSEGIELYEVSEAERAPLASVEDTWIRKLESDGVEGAREAVDLWKSLLEKGLSE